MTCPLVCHANRYICLHLHISVFDNEPAAEGQEWAEYVEGVKAATIDVVCDIVCIHVFCSASIRMTWCKNA